MLAICLWCILKAHQFNLQTQYYAALCHCPPHTGLSVTHELPTSAEISWKPLPEGEQKITGYSVQIVGAGSTREISVSDARATSITVSKLQPSTYYTFNVSAVTNTVNGAVATITSITPDEGEPATYKLFSLCIFYNYHEYSATLKLLVSHYHRCKSINDTRGSIVFRSNNYWCLNLKHSQPNIDFCTNISDEPQVVLSCSLWVYTTVHNSLTQICRFRGYR